MTAPAVIRGRLRRTDRRLRKLRRLERGLERLQKRRRRLLEQLPQRPTIMYDTITVGTVPPNPPAVAGYVGGRWPTYRELVNRFPNAHHLSIAVNAGEDATCLDVEPGDATVAQAATWVRRQLHRGVRRPVVYCSVSSAQPLVHALAQAGIPRTAFRLWTAHYTNHPHLCGPACGFGLGSVADATQYTDRALGRNLDESLCATGFWT